MDPHFRLNCSSCGKEIQGKYFFDVITSRTHDGWLIYCPPCKAQFDQDREARPTSYWDYDVQETGEGWVE
jgi:NAD-dependent SIR2 family protein deacetylase